MKNTPSMKLLTVLMPKMYSLAYVMLPDDLQAEQLVVDSVQAFSLKFSPYTKNPEQLSELTHLTESPRAWYRELVTHMVELGIKRAQQLGAFATPETYSHFYNQDISTRIILYLRYRDHMNVEEMSKIMSLPRFEIMRLWSVAREQLKASVTLKGDFARDVNLDLY